MAAHDLEFQRYVVDEVLRAAGELGVHAVELSADTVQDLRLQLGDLYGHKGQLITFERMANKAAIQDPDALPKLNAFLGAGRHIVFYDSPGHFDRSGVAFDSGSEIVDVIGECF